jgi:hypothetical protein
VSLIGGGGREGNTLRKKSKRASLSLSKRKELGKLKERWVRARRRRSPGLPGANLLSFLISLILKSNQRIGLSQ